eukprot:PITA_36556
MSRESRAKEAIDILQVLDWKGLKADANTDASRLNIYADMKGLKEDIGRARKPSTFITRCRRKECSLIRPYLLTSLRHGQGKEALNLYHQMQAEEVQPDKAIFVNVLKVFSERLDMTLEQRKAIHDDVVRCGFESDLLVGNALINMYGKCGDIQNAHQD